MTVLLSRPNGHEGRLFDGSTAVSLPKFAGAVAGDEQLLMAREIGMVFAYMNLDTVWTSFCDVYNGILSLLTTFNDWYRRQTGDTSELRLEWPRFIRSELDMVVKSARDNLKALEQARKLSPLFTLRWRTIIGVAKRRDIEGEAGQNRQVYEPASVNAWAVYWVMIGNLFLGPLASRMKP